MHFDFDRRRFSQGSCCKLLIVSFIEYFSFSFHCSIAVNLCSLQMAGISVVGRNYYGVFPLRGKLLNVREASHKQIMDNAEIQHIKHILGLQHGKVYDSVKSLRYGHLMIMTDQVASRFSFFSLPFTFLLTESRIMLFFSLHDQHLIVVFPQDHDGSHIKGLLINFIHSFWPSLLKVPSFLVEFITPIVKVLAFY